MRQVRTEITIAAPAKEVLRAFTDPGRMREWWGLDRGPVEAKDGGVWALAWAGTSGDYRYVIAGQIRSYQAHEHLHIDNLVYFEPRAPVLGPMLLMIDLKVEGPNTHLTVCQDGYQTGGDWDWYYENVVQEWPVALALLKRFLEGRTSATQR